MSRSLSRETVFKLVYEYTVNKEVNKDTIESFNDGKVDMEYVNKVYFGVVENFESLVQEISNFSKGFSENRIFKVDLSIMLIAVYEIKYMPEIPNAVSINEAVNLAKSYSTEKSFGFINGILSNFVKKA